MNREDFFVEKEGNETLECDRLMTSLSVWVNGVTYPLHNGNEKLLQQEKLSLHLEQTLSSHTQFSQAFITNQGNQTLQAKLLIFHEPRATNNHFTFVSPKEKVLFHCINRTLYLANGRSEDSSTMKLTVQPPWNLHANRIWNCENKGLLKFFPMSKGGAASILSFDMTIPPNSTKTASTWLIEGQEKEELFSINKGILKNRLAFPIEK